MSFKWFYETSCCPLDDVWHADVEGKFKLFIILAWPNCSFVNYRMYSKAFVRLLSSGISYYYCTSTFEKLARRTLKNTTRSTFYES